LRFGRKDNFWQMAETGPCGPNSEINYYLGDEPENPEKNRADLVNADEGDTTMEIWNLVFMQYNRVETEKGVYKLEPLPAPSVDTGAGLERMTVVMEGVHSTFETSLLKPIVKFTEGLSILSELESEINVEIDLLANLLDSYKIPFELIFSSIAEYRIEVTDNYEKGIPLKPVGVLTPSFKVSFGTPHLINIRTGEPMPAKDYVGESEFKSRLERAVQRYKIVPVNLDEQKQFACRVIADHARTTAFSIADGILPSNEGRNYVLRKIMRRAIYHGREHLGFKDAFFYKVCDFVVDQMKDAYPELDVQRDYIGKMVQLEEERFGATLTVGLKELKRWLDENIPIPFNLPILQFEMNSLAKFNDTLGLPVDLIYVIISGRIAEINRLRSEGTALRILDSETFTNGIEQAIKELQKQSGIGQTKQKETLKPIYTAMERTSVRSNFHGYEKTQVEDAKVIALVKDDQQTNELKEGEEGLIVLNETPFYAESGGQVGDTGTLVRTAYGSGRLNANNSIADDISNASNSNLQPSATADGSDFKATVFDTFAPIAGIVLHKSKIEKGSIKVGDEVTAMVDTEKRDATRRNHTATHLLHAALREVLGTHVKQAGSVVAPNYLRFDFSHYHPISNEEINEIEDLVNREILKNDVVNTNLMPVEEAMRSGAMALFGEKYGSDVRVLSIGEGTFSKELCGGTHVRATGDIGSFKILSDEAIASGTRRIRAITGLDSFARFREGEQLIEKSLGALRTQRDNLPSAIERLQEELKRAKRENDELKMKIATGAVSQVSSNGDEARDVNGVKVVAKTVEGLDKGGMRHLSDTLLAKLKSGVVVLARTEEDKVSFIVRVSDDLTDKVKAGKIVQEIAPIVGGRGGGKADMAEGGGSDASKLTDALEESYKVVEQMLG